MDSIKAKIKSYACRLFFKQVLYAHNEQTYEVNFNSGDTKTNDNSSWLPSTRLSAKIVILSRSSYREQLQWYPITKKKDVAKLLDIQLAGANCPIIFVIGNVVNGKTPVTYYYLDKLPSSLKVWFYIPETLLLANKLEYGEILSYSSLGDNRTMFVAKAIGGVVSAYKGGMIQSPLQFALSQGMNTHKQTDSREDKALSEQDLGAHLLSQTSLFYKLPLFGLINRKAFAHESVIKKLSAWAIPAALVFSFYLVITTQLAHMLVEHNKSELALAKSKANTILAQRESILNMNDRLTLLDKYSPSDGRLLMLWDILSPLYGNDVVFERIEKTADKVVLQVVTSSASQMLGLLISQPGVSNAQFDSAVRRQGNMDEATISFILKWPEGI